MNNRKKVTENDVKEVFLTLMEENDETTSKEVKEELRDQGFWVTQTEVSSIIRTNYKNWEGNTSIVRSFDNDHFIYFFGVVNDDEDEAQNFLLNKSKLTYTSDVNGGGYASLANQYNQLANLSNKSGTTILIPTQQPKPKKGKFIKVEAIEADLFKVTVSILEKYYDIVVTRDDINIDSSDICEFDFEDYDFKYRVVSKESDEDVYEYEIYVPNDYNINLTTNQARYYAWIVENRFGNKDIEYFNFRIKK